MFCVLSSTLMLVGQILLTGGSNTSPDLQRRTITDGPSYCWCGTLLSKNSLQPLYLMLPWDLSMEYNHGAGLMAIQDMYSLSLPSAPAILAFCLSCEVTFSMILAATFLILSSPYFLGFSPEYYILYFRRINPSQSNLFREQILLGPSSCTFSQFLQVHASKILQPL